MSSACWENNLTPGEVITAEAIRKNRRNRLRRQSWPPFELYVAHGALAEKFRDKGGDHPESLAAFDDFLDVLERAVSQRP